MSFVEGLPVTAKQTVGARVGRYTLLGWLVFGGGGCIGGQALGAPTAVIATSAALFALWHVGAVLTGIALQSKAKRLFAEATRLLPTDPRTAHAKMGAALRLGIGSGTRWLEAWLLVAQVAEEAGAFADAEEALRRGLASAKQVERGLLVHAHLLRAFVAATAGHVDAAERELMTCGALDVANPLLYAEYMRAKAMILYRRERYREVVDAVNEARARAAVRHARDAVLYASLEHSSMLRLEAAAGMHPMRVAHAPEAEAWLENAAPELSQRAMKRAR